MSPAAVIFAKECVENLRDRRTVLNSLVMAPLLGPLLFTVFLTLSAGREVAQATRTLELPVAGAAHAPELVEFLGREGIEVREAPADPEAAVHAQDVELVMVVPESFRAERQAGRPAGVELLFDSSRRDSAVAARRLHGLLELYNRGRAEERLAELGLGPGVLTSVAASNRDVSTPQSRAALLFAVVPYLMILTAFIGGMYLAIDTTAGERERQSLEPLLVNPVARWQVVIGKLAATFAFTMAAVALTLVAFKLAGRLVPVTALGLGMRFDLDLEAMTAIALIMAPLGLLAATVQTTIAAFARSYREAQTYIGLVLMVPLIPAVVLMVTPMKLQLWMAAVPLLSQHLLIQQVVRGDALDLPALVVCLGAGATVAALAGLLLVALYGREDLAISG